MNKRVTKIILLIGVLISSTCNLCFAQGVNIEFRQGSDVLIDTYRGNNINLAELSSIVTKYEDVILTGNGHIRIVANIPLSQKNSVQIVNQGALRASVINNYLRGRFKFLTQWNFSFFVNPTNDLTNIITVSYIAAPLAINAPAGIFYTNEKANTATIKSAIAKYGGIPFLSEAKILPDKPQLGERTNKKATDPVEVAPVNGEHNPQDVLIAIYYRWDKSNLDSLYLSNPQNLHLLDSILTSNNSRYIDTLTIVAFASPEGNVKHNQDLSEWRAKTIRNYIATKYPSLPSSRIITEARGENWQGVLKFAEADKELPSRDKVLEILQGNMSNEARQRALTALDSGTTYYRYILPNYYRYLRNGASILITYMPKEPQIIPEEPKEEVVVIEPPKELEPKPIAKTRYLIALRTNLLYDAIGAINLGVEIPIKESFSLIIDGAYSYWRSSKNLYALQTLEYGIEGRYWFGVSDYKKTKNAAWVKPLKGWNIGVYGRYWQRYDVQWIDGVQGDDTVSAGLTAGYAFPIGKQLSLEASVGGGGEYKRISPLSPT